MAFVRLIFTANSLNKLQKELIQEKEEAYKLSQGDKTKKKFKLSHIRASIEDGIKRCCGKIFSLPEKSCLHRTCYRLQHDGSCENYTIKSVFGFFGGIILTYVLFIFFVFQLNLRLTTATIFCSFLGCILTVGLAFSTKIRCIVLLTLPQFFSKKGRQALLAYGFILALTGPAQNTLNNLGILSESLACGQEQLKQAVRQIIEVIKKPFLAIKEAIKKVVKTVKDVVKMIKEIFLKIKRIIMAIVKIIKAAFEFLGKIINICNKELGTPFQRCTRVFENAILDCNAKLGPLFSWMCSITYIVKAVCYIVKIFDYVCMLVDFFTDSIIGVVIRKVKSFIRHVKTMFYVRIKFAHSYKFQTTASKTMKDIAKEIVKEIKDRSKGIVAFFTFMTSAAMLFFIFIVFQIKFLTSERFDNIYISKHFRQIDMRRAKLEKETVLPLNKREEKVYVPITSGKLAKIERKSLAKSITTLGTATAKLGTHMLFDYCLYWILDLISYHARFQSKQQLPNLPTAHVTGEGLLAKLLRVIVKAFQPVGIELEIDTVPCLPIPIPPNYDRYVQIAIVVVICWILTFLEPYGLRFRNYIMGYYHPVRAKQRTIWLYNHILRSRVSFLDLARRALKRKFGHKGADRITCKEYLQSHIRCGIFRICLGSDLQVACMVCGEVFRESDSKKPIKCSTPGCPGVFCDECFKDLNNICPICLNPIEYGEVEDEEKDSSGDERPPKPSKKRRKCRWFPCCRKTSDDDEKPLVLSEDEPAQDKPQQIIDAKNTEEEEEESPKTKEADLTDSSTDYSYSYQFDDVQKQTYPEPYPIYKDVEKQMIPDYESMQSFQQIEMENIEMEKLEETSEEPMVIELEIDNKLKLDKGQRAKVELSVSSEVTDDELEDEKEIESVSLLNRYGSEENKHVEFIGVPEVVSKEFTGVDKKSCIGTQNEIFNKSKKKIRRKIKVIPSQSGSRCRCTELEHVEETSFISLPKSTTSTSTRNDCRCCHLPIIENKSSLSTTTKEELKNLVPPLDLSFIDNTDESSQTSSARTLSERFQKRVKYQEVCETPTSSPRSQESFESSSVLTDLQESPVRNKNLRKRNVKTQYKPQIAYVQCPSSPDCYDFEKRQSKKVSGYYKQTNKYPEPKCQKPKKNNVRELFQRILPKRYTRAEAGLPTHRRPAEEEFEIQSYNYCQHDWEGFDSPLYPFIPQCSSESSDIERLLPEKEKNSRLRGGQSSHLIECKLVGGNCPRRLLIEPKSRTTSNNFSQISLPLEFQPLTTKELFSRYFTSIEDLTPTRDPGLQMTQLDTPKSVAFSTTEQESAINLTDRTVSSSDSCLSEATCFALFGGPCPAGLRQKLDKRNSTEIPRTPASIAKKSETEDLTNNSIVQKLDKRISTEIPPKSIAQKSETEDFTNNSKLNSNQSADQQSKESVFLDARSNLEINLENKSSQDSQKLLSQESESSSLKNKISSEKRLSLEKLKSNSKNQIEAKESSLKQLSTEDVKESSSTRNSRLNLNSTESPHKILSPQESALFKKESKESLSQIKKESKESLGQVKKGSKESLSQFKKGSKESLSQVKKGSKESLRSNQLLTGKQKSPTQLAFEKLEQIKEYPEESSQPKSSPSSQLNQLLYKDDKTEICLVQNLASGSRRTSASCPIQNITNQPSSSRVQSISSPAIKPGQSPLVKLQVNLHNSLISEDQTKAAVPSEIDMESPRSKDKVVETREVFPFRKDWTRDTSSSSRIVLASDKQQQTSDNDFYHASNNTISFKSEEESSSTVECCKCKQSSTTSHQTSQQSSLSDQRRSMEPHYYDTPERDSDGPKRNNCKCIYQKQIPSHRQKVNQETTTDCSAANIPQQCYCCTCKRQTNEYKPTYECRMRAKTPPREYRTEYKTLNFPSTSSDCSIPTNSNPPMGYPEFLPPPPPRPPYTRNHSPRIERTARMERTPRMEVPPCMEAPPYRKHRGKCYEGCRCCYNTPRVPPPPQNLPYRNINEYPSYSDDDNDFEESHSNTSLTDLPYQDKEEYMGLVQELQDTLHTRNRNRVRRAMQEFEQKSKHNQPLEKPIINYDEASESEEPIIRKLNELTGKEKKRCCAEEKCNCRAKSPGKKSKPKRGRRKPDSSPGRPCHWSMDSDSGEWYRKCRCSKPHRDSSFRGYDEQYHCNCNCERRTK